jgi:Zn-dependent protease
VICAAGPLFNILVSMTILVASSYNVEYFQADYVSAQTAMLPLFCDMSLLVAVSNLLPLPPFDGGRLVLIAVTSFRGECIPAALERRLLAAGFSALTICSLAALMCVADSLSK